MTAVAGRLAVPPDGLAAHRQANVTAFLAGRGLSPGELAASLAGRVGPGQLLLTSSPVHGLANATSDLDFIRIQPEPLAGPRIATKIFEQGQHLEVVSFAEAEVRGNLDELARLATRPPAEVVAALRGWDAAREPRRKQTERIVNGVTLDGRMPYLDALPALGVVWSRAALAAAVEQAAHLCLAEAAGELRGRVGYAVNALLHTMDALLSAHGDVYTTRKWYLLRWARFVRAGRWRDEPARAAGGAVERLRRQLAGALTAGPGLRLAGPYAGLVQGAAEATGAARRVTVHARLVDGAERHPFLPGAAMVLAGGTGVLLPAGLDPDACLTGCAGLDRLPGIAPEPAAALLRALRAGVARLHLGWDEEAAG